MARVSYVEKDQADPKVRELYQSIENHGNQIINLFKVMGHCPYIGLNFQRLGNAIRHGEELPATLRELAILRVGDLNKAEYEFKQHVRIGLETGVRRRQIDEIAEWQASGEFDDRERAVLRYTDEVTRDVAVTDDTFAKLKAFFSDHAIVELTTAIGYYAMVCRVLVALQVDLEPDA